MRCWGIFVKLSRAETGKDEIDRKANGTPTERGAVRAGGGRLGAKEYEEALDTQDEEATDLGDGEDHASQVQGHYGELAGVPDSLATTPGAGMEHPRSRGDTQGASQREPNETELDDRQRQHGNLQSRSDVSP